MCSSDLVYVPDEVVIACKGIVTGLCGGSQFWVPDGEKAIPIGDRMNENLEKIENYV